MGAHGSIHGDTARLRAVLDALPDSILALDERGRVEEWWGAHEWLSAPPAGVIGYDLSAADLPTALADSISATVERARRTRSEQRSEFCLTDGADTSRRGRITVRPRADGGYVAVIADAGADHSLRERLVHAEAPLQRGTSDAAVLAWTASTEGHVVYVSDSWVDFTGCSRAELLGDGWLDYVHGEDLSRAARELRVAHASGREDPVLEYRLRRADGEYRWFATALTPWHDSEGRVIGWAGAAHDITRQRAAETARRGAEQRLRAVFEATPAASVIVQAERGADTGIEGFRILDHNHRFARLIGRDDLTGRSIRDLDLTPWDHTIIAHLAACLTAGGGWEGEIDLPAALPTSWRRACMQVTALQEEDALVVSLTDLTDARRAERERFEVSEHLRRVLEGSPLVVFTQDAQLRYTWILNQSVSLTGERDITGLHDEDVLGEAAAAVLVPFKQRVLDTGEAARERLCIPGAAGPTWWDVYLEPLRDADGALCGVAGTGMDVTAEHRQQRAYEILVNQSGVGLALCDPHGVPIYLTPSLERMLGHGAEAFEDGFERFIDPDDLPRLRQAWADCCERSATTQAAYRCRRADGAWIWLESTYRGFVDEDGRTRVLVTAQDVSERVSAEHARDRAAAHRAAIIGSLFDGLAVIDPDGVIVEVNDRVCELTGFSREDLIGRRPPYPHWDPEHAQEIARIFPHLEDPDGGAYEYSVRCKNGEQRTFVMHARPLVEGGVRTGRVAILRDVTEERREAALRRAAERLHESILAALQDGLAVVDPDGRAIEVNDAMCAMTGYAPEQLLNITPPFPYWPAEHQERITATFARATTDAARLSVELTFARRSGERFPALIHTAPLYDDHGEVVGYMATIRDLTEQRRAEEALRRSEAELRQLAENMADMVVVARPDGLWTYASPSAEALLGWSAEELVGQYHGLDLLGDAAEQDELRTWWERARVGEAVGACVYQLRHRNGHLVDVETTGRAVRDETGAVTQVVCLTRDVGDRERALRRARDAEQQFRLALSGRRTAVFIQDLELRYTFLFDPRLDDSGESCLGRTDAELFGPDAAHALMPAKRRVIAGGHGERLDFTSDRLHSQRITFDVQLEPLLDAHGAVIGVAGVAADVSDQRATEQQLARSQDRFRAAIEASPDAFVIMQAVRGSEGEILDFQLTDHNHRLREWLGDAHHADARLSEVRYPQWLPHALPLLVEALTRGEAREDDWVTSGPPDPVESVRLQAIPLTAEDAVALRITDISARMRIEHELAETREISATLIESMREAVVVFGPDGSTRAANPAFRTLFDLGDRPLPAVAAPWWEGWEICDEEGNALPPQSSRTHQALHARRHAPGRITGISPPGGHRRWVSASSAPLPDGGAVLTLVDVGDLLEARRRAEAATRAKDQFLAMMSHELRTPMNGVIGLLEILSRGRLGEQERENLTLIRISANELLGLLNEVIEYTQMEVGTFALTHVAFTPREVIRSALRPLAERTCASPRLIADLDATLDAPRVGDPDRISQLLAILVDNALKFTPAGEVRVQAHLDQDCLSLRVADTGIGMNAEVLDRLFTPFTQADSSPSRRYQGSGLGLALARRIVDLMGGTIRVTSTEGAGTTFALAIPLASAPEGSLATHPFRCRADCSVLIVDDDETNATLTALQLGELGARPRVVATGAQALTEIAAHPDTAVLLDWQLPDIDGPEVARRMRTAGYAGPIILISGHDLHAQRHIWQAAGIDAALTKPVTIDTLARAFADLSEARE